MNGHLPDRPSWECGACRQPWPCDPAREDLASKMDGVVLPMFMVARVGEAAGEMPGVTAGELFERFIAWTRPVGVADSGTTPQK